MWIGCSSQGKLHMWGRTVLKHLFSLVKIETTEIKFNSLKCCYSQRNGITGTNLCSAHFFFFQCSLKLVNEKLHTHTLGSILSATAHPVCSIPLSVDDYRTKHSNWPVFTTPLDKPCAPKPWTTGHCAAEILSAITSSVLFPIIRTCIETYIIIYLPKHLLKCNSGITRESIPN